MPRHPAPVAAPVAALLVALLVAPLTGSPQAGAALTGSPQAAAPVAGSPSPAPFVTTRIPVAPGCFVVGPAWAGIKVHLVQRRLGTTAERERYGPATTAAVARFQRARGLPVTGRVDAATWRRLGTGVSFCVDRYTAQPALPLAATSSQRIEAMVSYAAARTGLPYLWGAAGPIGYDCSGLVLQSLHAAGLAVPAATTYLHQQRSFTTSAVLYAGARLTRVPLAERRRGDLLFFGTRGRVSHVAVYLGGDRLIEAVRPRVRVGRLAGYPLPVMPLVVRPFTGP